MELGLLNVELWMCPYVAFYQWFINYQARQEAAAAAVEVVVVQQKELSPILIKTTRMADQD